MEQPPIKPTLHNVNFNCPIALVERIDRAAKDDSNRTRSNWLIMTIEKVLDELEKREQKT